MIAAFLLALTFLLALGAITWIVSLIFSRPPQAGDT